MSPPDFSPAVSIRSAPFFSARATCPQVHELAWLLSVVTPMGLLERAHSYKDKIAQGAETHHGLFAYPVLMAADILLYNSDLVPVGKDQKQHLEIARDIAQKFNDRFGPVFKMPEPIIREATAIVPGIDGRKMSKSYGNTIALFGEEKEIKKPVMGIKTDSTPIDQPKQIEGTVLGQLMQAVNPEAYEDFVAEGATPGIGYGDLKKKLARGNRTNASGPSRKNIAISRRSPTKWKPFSAMAPQRARALAQPVLAAGAHKPQDYHHEHAKNHHRPSSTQEPHARQAARLRGAARPSALSDQEGRDSTSTTSPSSGSPASTSIICG